MHIDKEFASHVPQASPSGDVTKALRTLTPFYSWNEMQSVVFVRKNATGCAIPKFDNLIVTSPPWMGGNVLELVHSLLLLYRTLVQALGGIVINVKIYNEMLLVTIRGVIFCPFFCCCMSHLSCPYGCVCFLLPVAQNQKRDRRGATLFRHSTSQHTRTHSYRWHAGRRAFRCSLRARMHACLHQTAGRFT